MTNRSPNSENVQPHQGFNYTNPADMKQNPQYQNPQQQQQIDSNDDIQEIFPQEQSSNKKRILLGLMILLLVFLLIITITGFVSEDESENKQNSDDIEEIMEFGKDSNFFKPVNTDENDEDAISVLDKKNSPEEKVSTVDAPIDETFSFDKTSDTIENSPEPEPVKNDDYFFDKEPVEPKVDISGPAPSVSGANSSDDRYPQPSSVEKYYYIQVATLLKREPDQRFIDRMKNLKLRVVVDSYQNSKGVDITRILVGPYHNRLDSSDDVTTIISNGIQKEPLVLKTRIH
jgi:hypothetical protein